MAGLEIRCDPALAEEVVFLELSARAAAGDGREAQAFQAQRSAVYEAEGSPERRDAAFQQLAARGFRGLGFAELFAERLEEVPLVAAHVQAVMVRRVFCRQEERVELYVLPGSTAHRASGGPATLMIDLQAARCRDRRRLVAWLRHELMHVSDMLDPAFAYEPHPELGGECEMERDLIRERFRLLWNLFVEGRMRRRGWPLPDAEGSRRTCDQAFASWEPGRREAVVQDLSRRDRATQRELLDLAADERLTRWLGDGGVRCPLCHFPTREGIGDWRGDYRAIAEAIQTDYPNWAPRDGACRQCADLYRSRAPALR